MKKIIIIISLSILALLSSTARAANDGELESMCAGFLYYAIGEAMGTAKMVYRNAAQSFMLEGAQAIGEASFIKKYEYAKRVANSTPDAKFQKIVSDCLEISRARN